MILWLAAFYVLILEISLLFFCEGENTYAHNHVRKLQIELNIEI